jgi:hypothetical protein
MTRSFAVGNYVVFYQVTADQIEFVCALHGGGTSEPATSTDLAMGKQIKRTIHRPTRLRCRTCSKMNFVTVLLDNFTIYRKPPVRAAFAEKSYRVTTRPERERLLFVTQ